MSEVVICKDCGREIGFVEKKSDAKLKSCCKNVNKPILKPKKEKPIQIPIKTEITFKLKKEWLLREIKRDYIETTLIFDRTRDFIGTYRNFNRFLKDLKQRNLIEKCKRNNTSYVRLRQ